MPVLMSTPSPARLTSSMMCSRAERLRLRPWLERMIQEQTIPELDWIDENAKIVRIPWKHAARHGWSRDKDASLFKEWAIHTNKYNPDTDEPKANPKIWKANFRCAINSLPDIEELKDQGKTKGNDAFKVYRLNPKKPKRSKTAADTSGVKKPRNQKNPKSRSRPVDKPITSVSSESSTCTSQSQLSIQCSSVSLNVITQPPPPPPPYECVLRERLESQKRFQLTCHETPIQSRLANNNRVGLQLNPGALYATHSPATLPPYTCTSNIHHTRTSPVPTPSTPCSTLSSPMSTPVSPPAFTFPNTTRTFPMQRMSPATLNIKQELNPDKYNDGASDSSSNMTDEEIVEMVVQMRDDSPVTTPTILSPPSQHDNSSNNLNGGNEWMTSTLDNKQYFSNVVSTHVDTASTSAFQSAASLSSFPPTTSHTYFPFPVPTVPSATPIIKEENQSECRAACAIQEDSQSCYTGNLNSFGF